MVWIFSIVSGNTAQFSSVQLLSCVPLFVTPWTVAHQAFLFKFVSIESVMPSNHLILCRPLLLPPSVFPCIRIFSNQLVLCIRWPNIGASASVFPMNKARADLLQDGLVGSPCSPRDFQESSPTPQFKSINSSALSFLSSPNLTSIHDYWKTQQWPQDWKRSILTSVPKKGSTKECSNHRTVALIFHASKVMLKIL